MPFRSRAITILRRSCSVLAAAAAVGSIVVAVVWALSRIISDGLLLWQYFFWIPGVAFLVVAAGLWIGSSVLAIAAGAKGRPTTRRPRLASTLRIAAGIACAAMGLHIALVDYRLHNAVGAVIGPSGGSAGQSLRILNWNAGGVNNPEQLLQPIAAQQADLIITVDACCPREWAEAAAEMGPDAAILFSRNMMLLSRFAIVRHAATGLSIPAPMQILEEDHEEQRIIRGLGRIPLLRHAAPPDGMRPRPDAGRAWYIELDTREVLGRTLIVWLIDLPSDIRLSRRDVAAQSMNILRRWEGFEQVLAPEGVISQAAGPGFPAPDIIMGDFNIPRGSKSLRMLTLDYPHAHSQAGWGSAATYPRHRPLVHIDHVFIGEALRARRYDIIDPGAGSHRMQVVEIESRIKGTKAKDRPDTRR